jgi:hypothetical protein
MASTRCAHEGQALGASLAGASAASIAPFNSCDVSTMPRIPMASAISAKLGFLDHSPRLETRSPSFPFPQSQAFQACP